MKRVSWAASSLILVHKLEYRSRNKRQHAIARWKGILSFRYVQKADAAITSEANKVFQTQLCKKREINFMNLKIWIVGPKASAPPLLTIKVIIEA